MKRRFAALLALAMCLGSLTACSSSTPNTDTADGTGGAGAANAASPVTIQVGFENTNEEPIGQAVEKWAELVEEQSGGTMKPGAVRKQRSSAVRAS